MKNYKKTIYLWPGKKSWFWSLGQVGVTCEANKICEITCQNPGFCH